MKVRLAMVNRRAESWRRLGLARAESRAPAGDRMAAEHLAVAVEVAVVVLLPVLAWFSNRLRRREGDLFKLFMVGYLACSELTS